MSAVPAVRQSRARSTPAARNAGVVAAAGTDGHVLTPAQLPAPRTLRLDLVDPVIAFVAYGIPAAQGSKRPVGGKRMVEQSAYTGPWREAVRRVARRAITEYERRTGQPWVALDEPVVVSVVVTAPATDAATGRGDIYVTGSPDLDKLQRAIGDAISPVPLSPSDGAGLPEAAKKKARAEMMLRRRRVSILHDDARIVGWERVAKVYPARTVDALGHSGVVVQVWRVADLLAAEATPVRVGRDGVARIQVGDFLDWAEHESGQPWQTVAAGMWQAPHSVLRAPGESLRVSWRSYGDDTLRVALRALALRGPRVALPLRQVTAA